jgi:hypothetical protein
VHAADEVRERHRGRASRGIEFLATCGNFPSALVELAHQPGDAVAKGLLNFFDLRAADSSDVLDLRFGARTGRRVFLSRALRGFDLLVSGLTQAGKLVLGFLPRGLGRLSNGCLALGRVLLGDFRLAALEGCGHIVAERRDEALE